MANPPDYTPEQRAALAKLGKLRREHETQRDREHVAIINALNLGIRVGVIADEVGRSREQVRLARIAEEDKRVAIEPDWPDSKQRPRKNDTREGV